MNEPSFITAAPVGAQTLAVAMATRRDLMSAGSLADRPGVQRDGPDHGRLITRVATERDKVAFAALFRHFAPRIKSYLIRRGADAAAAEELAQEALLTVWRKANRYDPTKAGASTWIFTIARNLWIDAIRRERRPELDPADPLLVPDAPAEADQSLEREQRDDRLRDALESLPQSQAEVVRLAFFEDLTHAEVAVRLGLPLGTVKSRLRLALDKVRGIVGDSV